MRPWLFGIAAMVFFLLLWSVATERKARVVPDYPRVNIENYLQQETLGGEEYELLFRQTGLSKTAIEQLLREGRQQEILLVQDNFFREVDIVCEANTIISREERCEESHIPYVEEGDILITFNSHALGWRNGHAAIVVDAGQRQTLEARVLGMDSAVMSMEHWEKYPSFVVLRLKGATREERKVIAEYAEEHLAGIPYHLTAGMKVVVREGDNVEEKEDREVTEVTEVAGTHCSHLVWYAYHQYGYNLDSDGGLIVTPGDIYESDLLEPVQIYGMEMPEYP